jgi:hypothetical protein
MNRLFVVTTATLTTVIGVLVGLLLSVPRPRSADSRRRPWRALHVDRGRPGRQLNSSIRVLVPASSLNFADIAARLNPAVVNIDATARGRRARQLIEQGGKRGTDDPAGAGIARHLMRHAAAPGPDF